MERKAKGNEKNRFLQMGPSLRQREGGLSNLSQGKSFTPKKWKRNESSKNQTCNFTNMEPAQFKIEIYFHIKACSNWRDSL
jgi:hypothetical protein